MKLLLIIALLELLNSRSYAIPSFCSDQPGDLSGFDWGTDPYTASGMYRVGDTYPLKHFAAAVPVTVFNDPVNARIAIVSEGFGAQYVTADNYYYVLPNGACSSNPDFNYTRYLFSYQQAIQIQQCLALVFDENSRYTYGGLVRDPGSCTEYSGITIVTNGLNQLVGYYQAQTLFVNGNVSKAFGAVDIDNIVEGVNSTLTLPPPSCATPAFRYCPVFYPVGHNYTLYARRR
jgi:hypothetical protein